jgi:hypothetical protein
MPRSFVRRRIDQLYCEAHDARRAEAERWISDGPGAADADERMALADEFFTRAATSHPDGPGVDAILAEALRELDAQEPPQR